MPGTLALIGSGEFSSALRAVDTLLLAQTDGRRVLVVPTAVAVDGAETVRAVLGAAREHFDRLGAAVLVAPVWTRDDAFDPAATSELPDADLIYIPGGKVGYLAGSLVGSPFAAALVGAWRTGRPLAAASAGAVLLGSVVYDPEDSDAPARPGLAVVDAAVIPHWSEVSSMSPFVERVRDEQPRVLTLDEDTAAVHETTSGWMIAGSGGALLGIDGEPWRALRNDDLPAGRGAAAA